MQPVVHIKPRVILIDDDQTYNAIMLRAAEMAGVHLDVYTSLMDLGSIARLGHYDVAIVDYHLEQMTGLEVAEYLSALFNHMPMILVSDTDKVPQDSRLWPKSVAAFVPKSSGYVAVVEHAVRIARRTHARRTGSGKSVGLSGGAGGRLRTVG